MQLIVFGTLMLACCGITTPAQHPSRYIENHSSKSAHQLVRTRSSRAAADFNLQIPSLSTNFQVTKPQPLPYAEILKLSESFLRLKGEVGSRIWTLFYDNAHILRALRDTLVSNISGLHAFTLTVVVILRKVMEFASAMFSNLNGGGGSSLLDGRFTLG